MLFAAMSMVIRFGSMLPRFAALNVSHRAIIKGFSTRRGNCVFHFCLSWWGHWLLLGPWDKGIGRVLVSCRWRVRASFGISIDMQTVGICSFIRTSKVCFPKDVRGTSGSNETYQEVQARMGGTEGTSQDNPTIDPCEGFSTFFFDTSK